MKYRGWIIECICPPIPIRSYDYGFGHERFDESTELSGYAETEDEAKKQIDELIESGILNEYEEWGSGLFLQPHVSGSLPLFKCKCGYETSHGYAWCVHADCCNGNDR